MTTEEMMKMYIDGATYQEIADICGLTKQNVHERVNRYSKRLFSGYRGCNFYVDDIKYDAIREYFDKNPYESVSGFSRKVGVYYQTMRNFLKGNHDTYFTIQQIRQICEIVGKPFEEVFGGADNE